MSSRRRSEEQRADTASRDSPRCRSSTSGSVSVRRARLASRQRLRPQLSSVEAASGSFRRRPRSSARQPLEFGVQIWFDGCRRRLHTHPHLPVENAPPDGASSHHCCREGRRCDCCRGEQALSEPPATRLRRQPAAGALATAGVSRRTLGSDRDSRPVTMTKIAEPHRHAWRPCHWYSSPDRTVPVRRPAAFAM